MNDEIVYHGNTPTSSTIITILLVSGWNTPDKSNISSDQIQQSIRSKLKVRVSLQENLCSEIDATQQSRIFGYSNGTVGVQRSEWICTGFVSRNTHALMFT